LKLRFQSYSSDSSFLLLSWQEDAPLDPLPSETLSNSLFHVTGQQTDAQLLTFRRGLQFSTLTANIFVERRTLQYEIKFVFPMALLVALACVQFFIDSSSAPARVGFGLTMTLTVTTFNIIVAQDLPRVGYTTLLDEYVVIGMFFTSIGVVEFALISFLRSTWLATSAPKPRSMRALAIAIEVFFRCAALPCWIVISVLFFVARPASTIAIVLLVLLVLAVAAWFARVAFLRASRHIDEQTAANVNANANVNAKVVGNDCQCRDASSRAKAGKLKRRVKRDNAGE
jgi:hypothetical protein